MDAADPGLDGITAPRAGAGSGGSRRPAGARQRVRDGSNTGVHAEKPGGHRGSAGEQGDRSAPRRRGPRPRCSARGILRRGPLFGRAGLRGRIPLSELGNILF